MAQQNRAEDVHRDTQNYRTPFYAYLRKIWQRKNMKGGGGVAARYRVFRRATTTGRGAPQSDISSHTVRTVDTKTS